MQYLRRDKKDEEESMVNPFQNIDKGIVLQEARVFNETPINIRKCIHILTKILYLINQGTHLGTVEATEAFFAMTKLFQSKDLMLRRMVYLSIKELSTIAEDVIIVTSSLTKDMTGKEDMFRGSAIRALCKITDNTMLQGIERYLKQAIVDKNPSVSSAALVSALHLLKPNYDVVKRWVNEAQEAVSSDNNMVQYHALGLLYHIKQSDRLAVSKLIAKHSKHSLRSPYAVCMLIRIASKYLDEEPDAASSPLYDFLENCLRHKSEMVIYEAARAIVNLKNLKSKDLCPAISVLQLFLSSPRPTLRFAAVRTLNKVAMTQPMSVTTCNLDLENLITDVNRSIATLAITTLLKTGNESSVERLMKQISSFMSEISDEFKIVVVEAIRSLCLKFPKKHLVMMNFLSSMLRDEGGFEYKKAIVDTIIIIIEENSEAKEAGLSHLCEFIEDCEHTVLATRILHLLGREGPRSQQPGRYIRFIYNRVILENAAVRAAAVTSLAKFGAHCESLLPSIEILLSRCLLDTDDEVRDRATFYLRVLQQKDKGLSSAYILNGLQVSIVGLERALHAYVKDTNHSIPFDLKTVPLATTSMQEQVIKAGKPVIETPAASTKPTAPVAAARQDVYATQLAAIPEFAKLGPLFRSSPKPAELTESETEYVVNCIKHVYTDHVVFQFDCTNTLNDQVLENVRVEVEPSDGEFEIVTQIPYPLLSYNQPGTTYTLIKLPDDPTSVACTFSCTLKFVVKDCDPNTGEADEEGYEDEYVLEDVDLVVADQVQPVLKTNFLASWEEVGDDYERQDTYALSQMSSLDEAVKQIIQHLGMQPCERSDRVPEGKSSHALLLAGVYRGNKDVLVKARLAFNQGVTMNITVRSKDESVSEVILSAVG
ncbi:coatomer subunit gamma-2-like [Actinia tenebrosa]|uniref:Coatomer subunit gamma n=1 Tax=Actinia tenebrosa TaxID=6105 RepID=A0A6P8I446_ACTTE|nr:coatomer subunit gamma-2-like [Actinia tenebrosa]